MKTLKLVTIALMMGVFTAISGQEKVQETERWKTELKTFKVEFIDGYYSNQLASGYRYPSIRSGFYIVGFFLRYTDLVKLYEELINIKNSEDGEYKLTVRMRNIQGVKKSGNTLIFKCLWYGTVNYEAFYSYTKRIKTKHLESDLQIIKEKFIHHNNK